MLKSYYLLTLGCQMNISDSERIESVLSEFNFIRSNQKEANLIIVNSCSVRQKPIDRIWGKLKRWNQINPRSRKILTGCVLKKDEEKLRKKFDFYFKIGQIDKLIAWLVSQSETRLRLENNFGPRNIDRIYKKNYLEIKTKKTTNNAALVPIMNGCDNFCSYCAVPYTRGREWSRKQEGILNEIRCKIKQGYREIILLGQNVNKYRINGSRAKDDFVELLKEIVKIKGDFEIKFMSPHPSNFSSALINLIAKEKKISKEIHLPMQSGDDEILRKMSRGYSIGKYLNLIKNLKLKIKNLRLSTDIIVGFPGETVDNFQNTIKAVKISNFCKAYISIYSPRPGTVADKKYEDDIPLKEKKRRWLILERLINKSKVQNSNPKLRLKTKI